MSDKKQLTAQDLLSLRDDQRGQCAICGRLAYGGLVPDHDRRTGAVRGLLCGVCAQGLEALDEDPDRLRAAADYIEAHRQQPSGLYYRPLSTPRASDVMTMREFLRGGYKETAGATTVVDGRRGDVIRGQWLPASAASPAKPALNVSHVNPSWLEPRPRVATTIGSGKPASKRKTKGKPQS